MRQSETILRMRFPSLSRCVHVALLFLSHFFLGTFVAVWGTYQYEQSRWFASLSGEQGKQLLSIREILLASQAPARGTPDALQRDLSRLRTLRRRAPQDGQAILDLRIASDHALLARLWSGNDPAAAAAQTEAAQVLLRELGWKDASDATLNELAERRVHAIGSRDVR